MRKSNNSSASFLATLVVCCTTTTTLVSSFEPAIATRVSVLPKAHEYITQQQELHHYSRSAQPLTSVYAVKVAELDASIADRKNGEEDEDDLFQFLATRKDLSGDVKQDEEFLRRKQEWAGRYTSVEALRETFGRNRNKLWGDLQAGTARRLYKTLLPRALLELSKVGGMEPQDLAPLAYQARVAAKLYARERSTVPLRLAATLFDGFRQWRRYGKFQAHGLTYDQLWEKYAKAIIEETEQNSAQQDEECLILDDDVSVKVSLLIIERSCSTNEKVDEFALKGNKLQKDQKELLEKIHSQLQQDVYQLLLPAFRTEKKPATNLFAIQHFRTLRMAARAKQTLMSKTLGTGSRREDRPTTVSAMAGINQPWKDRMVKPTDRTQRWVQRPPRQ